MASGDQPDAAGPVIMLSAAIAAIGASVLAAASVADGAVDPAVVAAVVVVVAMALLVDLVATAVFHVGPIGRPPPSVVVLVGALVAAAIAVSVHQIHADVRAAAGTAGMAMAAIVHGCAMRRTHGVRNAWMAAFLAIMAIGVAVPSLIVRGQAPPCGGLESLR